MQEVKAEDVLEEVLDITNLAVLVDDEVGLEMKLVPTNDYNDPTPESAPESMDRLLFP